MGRVVCGTPAARAERIVALPNIKKIPVQGLAVPRTELREGGAKGTGEEGLFGINGGRGRVEESVGGGKLWIADWTASVWRVLTMLS